jgi:hypothetical protein
MLPNTVPGKSSAVPRTLPFGTSPAGLERKRTSSAALLILGSAASAINAGVRCSVPAVVCVNIPQLPPSVALS